MFNWTSAAITDIGKRRKVNEDAYLALPEKGLWVVADGMGGYDAGEVASNAIIDELKTVQPPPKMSAFVNDIETRLLKVNTQLYEMSEKRRRTIGSTVVALLALKSHCVVLWAGDSRVYRYRAGKLKQLTQDHSQVEELIEQGELSREDAQTHPDANIITRAVGAEQDLFLDLDIFPAQHKDIFLICSDGLYREVTDSEIAKVLSKVRANNAQKATEVLIQLTLRRRGKDNITVIIIQALSKRR